MSLRRLLFCALVVTAAATSGGVQSADLGISRRSLTSILVDGNFLGTRPKTLNGIFDWLDTMVSSQGLGKILGVLIEKGQLAMSSGVLTPSAIEATLPVLTASLSQFVGTKTGMSIADHLSNDNVLDLRALATSRTYAQVVSAQKSQFSLEAVLRSAVTAVLLDTKQDTQLTYGDVFFDTSAAFTKLADDLSSQYTSIPALSRVLDAWDVADIKTLADDLNQVIVNLGQAYFNNRAEAATATWNALVALVDKNILDVNALLDELSQLVQGLIKQVSCETIVNKFDELIPIKDWQAVLSNVTWLLPDSATSTSISTWPVPVRGQCPVGSMTSADWKECHPVFSKPPVDREKNTWFFSVSWATSLDSYGGGPGSGDNSTLPPLGKVVHVIKTSKVYIKRDLLNQRVTNTTRGEWVVTDVMTLLNDMLKTVAPGASVFVSESDYLITPTSLYSTMVVTFPPGTSRATIKAARHWLSATFEQNINHITLQRSKHYPRLSELGVNGGRVWAVTEAAQVDRPPTWAYMGTWSNEEFAHAVDWVLGLAVDVLGGVINDSMIAQSMSKEVSSVATCLLNSWTMAMSSNAMKRLAKYVDVVNFLGSNDYASAVPVIKAWLLVGTEGATVPQKRIPRLDPSKQAVLHQVLEVAPYSIVRGLTALSSPVSMAFQAAYMKHLEMASKGLVRVNVTSIEVTRKSVTLGLKRFRRLQEQQDVASVAVQSVVEVISGGQRPSTAAAILILTIDGEPDVVFKDVRQLSSAIVTKALTVDATDLAIQGLVEVKGYMEPPKDANVQPDEEQDKKSKKGLPLVAILGICLGVGVGVILLVAAVVVLVVRAKKKNSTVKPL